MFKLAQTCFGIDVIAMGNAPFVAFCRAQAWAQDEGVTVVPNEVLAAIAEPNIWADVVKSGVATYDSVEGLTLAEHSTGIGKRRTKRCSKAEQLIPKDWKPTNDHVKQAQMLGLDISREADMFRDHAEAHSRKAVMWDAAFRMWLRKANDYRGVASSAGRGYNMQEL